ncbi:MAG TPA: serine/threonine-protein kinase, partial [Kofleriaceae bacterium]|nr:serine/threonine-protein kinase [Kofleriaceae bacterium]
MDAQARGDPLLGTIVGGRYEVVALIGKGAMGRVYEVRHQMIGRLFALKTLNPNLVDDAPSFARFRREAEVVGRFRHPNIVEVVDWETLPDGAPAIVMERLRGEDLAARIARGRLAWNDLTRIAGEILAALEVAHRAGVVHRDLKPSNVFLAVDDTGSERVKLLDFGVSRIQHQSTLATSSQRLIGTPAYMSPEQAQGKVDVGPEADVWAAAVITYEMAAGRLPFPGNNLPAMLHAICYQPPELLQPLRPDAPPALEALLQRALTSPLREPGATRIRDVATLTAELTAALPSPSPAAGRGQRARTPSVPPPRPAPPPPPDLSRPAPLPG